MAKAKEKVAPPKKEGNPLSTERLEKLKTSPEGLKVKREWVMIPILITVFMAFVFWVLPKGCGSTSPSPSSSPTLSYVLCDGVAGPPGVKDFDSLPPAGSDPKLCFGATVKRELDGRGLSLEVRFSDKMSPFNHFKYGEGTLIGWSPSVRGTRFGWNWQSYDAGTNRTHVGEEEDNPLLYDERTGIYKGVYARKDKVGAYSQILIRPQ